ncbi:MAG: signal peptidase I [Roseimicrobium sp.]
MKPGRGTLATHSNTLREDLLDLTYGLRHKGVASPAHAPMFFLTPRYLKNAKLLHKGVTRFLVYKRDLLPSAKAQEITALRTRLEAAMKGRDKAEIESLTKTINKTCEVAMPSARQSEFAENVEVFFVSIVIALGIRSYIAQPFQIPTSSMQPTLNGIIAVATPEDPRTGILGAVTGFFTGTTQLNVVSDHDGYIDPRTALVQHQFFLFRPYCKLHFTDGHKMTIRCPKQQLEDELRLWQNMRLATEERAATNPDMRPELLVRADGTVRVQKGQLLARGLVSNGDHVMVNKFAYHFRKPTRGEVFVFTTKNIRGIEAESRFDPRWGSQHYIKRLVGVPGDTLDLDPPHLLVNGAPAKEPGIRRVADEAQPLEAGNRTWTYHGYSGTHLIDLPVTLKTEPRREYFAMGDNSFRSSDSRYWGPVPEQNIVGPGWMCYWPLTKHWGFIW